MIAFKTNLFQNLDERHGSQIDLNNIIITNQMIWS